MNALPAIPAAQNVEVLLERIAMLERSLIGAEPIPEEFDLTPSQATVLRVLLKQPVASRDMLLSALYRSVGRDEPDPFIIRVYVSHIRRKTRHYGVVIEAVWYTGGYRLTQESKAIIRGMAKRESGTFMVSLVPELSDAVAKYAGAQRLAPETVIAEAVRAYLIPEAA